MSEFKINAKNNKSKDIAIKAYTFWGMHETEDESGFPLLELEEDDDMDIFMLHNVFAAELVQGKKVTYYVKRGKYGKLYDPIGMYSEGKQKSQMRHAGKPEWVLKPTSKKVFDLYRNYLKTKNSAWLNNAEREVV
jgi:hypothetical protein